MIKNQEYHLFRLMMMELKTAIDFEPSLEASLLTRSQHEETT